MVESIEKISQKNVQLEFSLTGAGGGLSAFDRRGVALK